MPKPSDYGSGFAYFFAPFLNIEGILADGNQYCRDWIQGEREESVEWEEISIKKETLDSRSEYHTFATLFFGTHTPTQNFHEKRGLEFAIIRYDADKLFEVEGAMFSEIALQNQDEVRGPYSCRSNSKALERLHWQAINSTKVYQFWQWGKYSQAELMIPYEISGDYIHDIVFKSENSRRRYFETHEIHGKSTIVDSSQFISPICQTCNDIDSVRPHSDYKTAYCETCEHNMNLSGWCLRKWNCAACSK